MAPAATNEIATVAIAPVSDPVRARGVLVVEATVSVRPSVPAPWPQLTVTVSVPVALAGTFAAKLNVPVVVAAALPMDDPPIAAVTIASGRAPVPLIVMLSPAVTVDFEAVAWQPP